MTQIFVEEDCEQYNDKCDGCDELIVKGQRYLSGIDSCCGGCYRRLCYDCVKKALEMFEAE